MDGIYLVMTVWDPLPFGCLDADKYLIMRNRGRVPTVCVGFRKAQESREAMLSPYRTAKLQHIKPILGLLLRSAGLGRKMSTNDGALF